MSFRECEKCGGIPGVTWCCKDWRGSGSSMIDGHAVSQEAACNPSMQVELVPQPPDAIQKAVQALIDAAILEGGALPPSQEAAMQATEQRKADLLKLLEPFIGTPLNE